ncbi:hypothetical protein BDB00DRAFT_808294 [Zychaea mexicana]|uniref:uncharacterized protein n=1 Tax=Zychaea mexicana TaxID=64656 RepID=UPI0022FEFDF0|nr:uncharacterized protein BDB00DRAFT_808294 [Zychaea mexicana]KAI9496674.1 hypothetical protein BDB00DRAFT_808294 [Zychaea mexicana]
MSDDDIDDDSLTDQVPFGYQQLAQDEDEGVSLTENADDDSSSDGQREGTHMTIAEAPPTVSLDKTEEIPEDTANTIKSIMGSIQMPDHAIPEWAKAIPESMWLPQYQQQQDQEADDRGTRDEAVAETAGTTTTTAQNA